MEHHITRSRASPSSARATSAPPTPSAWPCSATTCSASTPTGARSRRSPPGEVPFFEPGLPEMLRKALDSGRLRFTHRPRRGRRVRRRPLHLRGHAAAAGLARRRPALRRGRGPRPRAVPAPALPGRRQVHGAGRHRRPADPAACRTSRPAGAGGRAGVEPRVPARGLRRRGHPAPGPAGLRRVVGRGPASSSRPRSRRSSRPARRWSSPTWRPPSWSRWRRTRSWPPRSPTSTRWPRSARPPAPTCRTWPRPWPTTRRIGGRFLQPGPRLRRRLPAQGHPRLRPPRRGARGRQVRGVPAPGRRDQQRGAASAPSTWSASRPAARWPASRSAASERPSSPTPTTSATPRRSTSPGCSRRRARSSASTTPRRWTTPAGPTPTSATPTGVMRGGRRAPQVVVLLTEWDQFRSHRPRPPRRGGRRPVDRRRPARAGRQRPGRRRLDLPGAGAGRVVERPRWTRPRPEPVDLPAPAPGQGRRRRRAARARAARAARCWGLARVRAFCCRTGLLVSRVSAATPLSGGEVPRSRTLAGTHMPRQRTDSPSVCRPCRRAQRRHRTEHPCYRAVLGEHRADATTWVACGCDCQRTLVSLGFFDLDGCACRPRRCRPARGRRDQHEPGHRPGSPASRCSSSASCVAVTGCTDDDAAGPGGRPARPARAPSGRCHRRAGAARTRSARAALGRPSRSCPT